MNLGIVKHMTTRWSLGDVWIECSYAENGAFDPAYNFSRVETNLQLRALVALAEAVLSAVDADSSPPAGKEGV